MNMRQRLLAGATVMLLASSPSWGAANCAHSQSWQCSPAHAPEIDAASGTSAIALLTGVLLLVGESKRSKRSSKSDE